MNQQKNWSFRLRVGLMVMASGMLLQIPGLGCISTGAGSVLRNFNPCGTILACDPFEYDYAIGRLDPFNPDFEECPVSVDAVDCANGVWPPTTSGGGTTTTP